MSLARTLRKGEHYARPLVYLLLLGILSAVFLSMLGVDLGLKLPFSTAQTTISGSGACPDTQKSTINVIAYADIPKADGTKEGIIGTAELYQVGTTTPIATAHLDGSNVVQLTANAECGTGAKYFVVVKNDTAIYPAKSEVFSPNKAIVNIEILAKKNSSVQLSFDNSTSLGASVGRETFTANARNTNLYLRIKAPDSLAHYGIGKRKIALCYDNSAWSEVEVIGGSQTTCESAITSGFSGTCKCFEVNGELANGQEVRYNLALTPAVDVSGGAYNITVKVNDYATYTLAKGGIVFEGYENENTGADVGTAIATATIVPN